MHYDSKYRPLHIFIGSHLFFYKSQMKFNVHENTTLTRFPEVHCEKRLTNSKLKIIGVTLSPT